MSIISYTIGVSDPGAIVVSREPENDTGRVPNMTMQELLQARLNWERQKDRMLPRRTSQAPRE